MYEAFYILLSLCNFRLAMTTKESKCSIKYPEQIDYFLTIDYFLIISFFSLDFKKMPVRNLNFGHQSRSVLKSFFNKNNILFLQRHNVKMRSFHASFFSILTRTVKFEKRGLMHRSFAIRYQN